MDPKPLSPAPAKSGPSTPPGVAQLLRQLPAADHGLVEALVCRLPTTREMVSAARFWDDVYERSRVAEHWIAGNRIKGVEFDAYYDRWMAAMTEVVKVAVELARRAQLIKVLQDHKRLLAHFGYQLDDLKVGEKKPKKKAPAGAEDKLKKAASPAAPPGVPTPAALAAAS